MAPEDILEIMEYATLKKLLKKIGIDLMPYGVVKHTGPGEQLTQAEEAEWKGLARYCGILGNIQRELKKPYPGQNKIIVPPSAIVPPPAPVIKPAERENLPFIPVGVLSIWQRYYQEVHGLFIDMQKVRFPKQQRPNGFGWNVMVAEELGAVPLDTLLAACRRQFQKVWAYTAKNVKLHSIITVNDRDPRTIGSYAIFCHANHPADVANSDLSADEVRSRRMDTMTLLERMILESFIFWSRNKHLDEIVAGVQTATLCSGSRDWMGHVPICEFLNNMFLIGQCDTRDHFPELRARSVVF